MSDSPRRRGVRGGPLGKDGTKTSRPESSLLRATSLSWWFAEANKVKRGFDESASSFDRVGGCCLGGQLFAKELRSHSRKDTDWSRTSTGRRDSRPEQYRVTRQDGHRTFRSTNPYWDNKKAGEYRCVCCDLPLFSSDAKYKLGNRLAELLPADRRRSRLAITKTAAGSWSAPKTAAPAATPTWDTSSRTARSPTGLALLHELSGAAIRG